MATNMARIGNAQGTGPEDLTLVYIFIEWTRRNCNQNNSTPTDLICSTACTGGL